MPPTAAFFVSYSHDDGPDVRRFQAVLNPLLKSSARYAFSPWTDHLILPGERWREEIEQALNQCRFGLLLLSPGFLSSEFIGKHELPVLLAKPMVVPVELQKIALDGSMDLQGLDGRQIFRDSKGRSFDACRTMAHRRDFALELFAKINALLEKHPC